MLTADGRPIARGKLLGRGGQGAVYDLTSDPGLVYKEFSAETLAKDDQLPRRLAAMTAGAPAERVEPASGHLVLAWPDRLVFEGEQLAGFLMPRVDVDNTVELHRITNPSDRGAASGATGWIGGFTWQYLVRAAANLAHATRVLHAGGVVIGDFNLKNVLVSKTALVTLIDCDSMQIVDPASGERFLCPVGMPEFLPPELVNADLRVTVRHPSGDLYALAIHLFQLLMQGEHPFRGMWDSSEEKPSVPELARAGMWSLRAGGSLSPRPSTIDAGLLPPEVLELFRRAFEDGAIDPDKRPTAAEWHQALLELDHELVGCRTDPSHWYRQSVANCPWCAHAAKRAARTAATTQMPLPSAQAPGYVPLPPLPPPTYPAQPQPVPAYPVQPTRPQPVPAYPIQPQPAPTYHRPPTSARRSGILIGAVATAIVLLGGGVAVAQSMGNGPSTPSTTSTQPSTGEDDTTTTDTTTTGTADTATTGTADTATAATTSTTTAGSGNATIQATAVRDLLGSSRASRRSIQAAMNDVELCGHVTADAAVFEEAAANRSRQRDRADSLDYSALPDSAGLHSSLVDALDASRQADLAFQSWANSLSRSCTRTAARNSPLRAEGMRESATARSHKEDFVASWNAVCDANGWAHLKETDI